MLLRINYETKLKLEASVILIIPFIIVVHIVIVILLSLLADAAALDSVNDIARQLSLLVMMLMRRRGGGMVVTAFLARLDVKQVNERWTSSCTRQCARVLYWRVPSILKLVR